MFSLRSGWVPIRVDSRLWHARNDLCMLVFELCLRWARRVLLQLETNKRGVWHSSLQRRTLCREKHVDPTPRPTRSPSFATICSITSRSRTSATSTRSSRRSSTAGNVSSSRTAPPPSALRHRDLTSRRSGPKTLRRTYALEDRDCSHESFQAAAQRPQGADLDARHPSTSAVSFSVGTHS